MRKIGTGVRSFRDMFRTLADAARRLDEKRAAIEIETKTGTQKERAETRLP